MATGDSNEGTSPVSPPVTPGVGSPPGINNNRLSVQFHDKATLPLPSAMHHAHSHSGAVAGGAGGSIGMPRTSTQSSVDAGKYRRKVGFEAFEAGPAALFAYTCQVGRCYC